MKVNFDNVKTGLPVKDLCVADTFTAPRKSNNKEIALYMKIDRSSGVFRFCANNDPNKEFAVNLSTGQLRMFDKSELVEPVNAEVFFK